MKSFLDGLQTAVENEGIRAVAARWGALIGLVLAAWAILGLVRYVVVDRLRRFGEHPRLAALSRVADVVNRTNTSLSIAVGLTVGRGLFAFAPASDALLGKVSLLAFFVQLGFWATESVAVAVERYSTRLDDPNEHQAALAFLAFSGRVVVWSVVVLLLLENVGFDVTTLVAGLGVGGIAIALAAQNILGDLFASLSLIVDKPFVPGDFIIVDDMMGTVEQIGLKTTRLRSLGGEQLIFSNADLLSTRVRNYQRLEERRVNFSFGIVYQTPTDQVMAVPDIVREVVESTDGVRFDRAHLSGFGDSAFEYEVIYWVLDPDYARFMDLHQSILFDVLEEFRDRGIELAYPTQTLHLDDGDTNPEELADTAPSPSAERPPATDTKAPTDRDDPTD